MSDQNVFASDGKGEGEQPCDTCGGTFTFETMTDHGTLCDPRLRPAPASPDESATPRCDPWCGKWAGELPDDGTHWDSNGQGFCTEDCLAARRPLNPTREP